MLPTATTFASLVCLLSATTRTSAGDATQLYAWRGLLDSPPTALSPALPFSGHAWHPFVLVRLPTDPFRKRSRGSTSSTSRWEVVATTLRTRRSSCGSSRVGPTRRPHTCTSEWTTALCRRDRCEPSRVSGFRVCVCVCVCVCVFPNVSWSANKYVCSPGALLPRPSVPLETSAIPFISLSCAFFALFDVHSLRRVALGATHVLVRSALDVTVAAAYAVLGVGGGVATGDGRAQGR